MPDLITHVAAAHLLRRPFELKSHDSATVPMRVLFYLGTILPDILTRPWYILFPATMEWTYPLHTPAGMILVCSLLALFMAPSIRMKAYLHLLGGGALHFLLDACQKHLSNNEFWFYPFSWRGFGFQLFWSGEVIPFIPYMILAVVLMEVFMAWYKRHQ